MEHLQGDGLLEGWKSPKSSLGIHELYCEFAKAEGIRDDNLDRQVYLYHEGGRNEDRSGVPTFMETIPCVNYWPLKRIFIYGGEFSGLSNRELQYMANVEVLNLHFCFELKSLDLQCLKRLRSLELRGCFQLYEVKGLKDLQHLKFFRWNTCRVASVNITYSKALEIVEIYGSKTSTVSGFGPLEECIALFELTLKHHLGLVVVPNLCYLSKLEKLDFSGCCELEEVQGLGGLICLRHLNLQNCKKLVCFGSVEGLVELETLNLEGCENMAFLMVEMLNLEGFKDMALPMVWDLRKLLKLRSINIEGNLRVQYLGMWFFQSLGW